MGSKRTFALSLETGFRWDQRRIARPAPTRGGSAHRGKGGANRRRRFSARWRLVRPVDRRVVAKTQSATASGALSVRPALADQCQVPRRDPYKAPSET